MNSYTGSLPVLNTILRLPGSQVLTFMILTKSSQCLLALLLCSAAFRMVFAPNVFACMHMWPSRNPSNNNCPIMGHSQWKSHEWWHSRSKQHGRPNVTRLFPPWERAWVRGYTQPCCFPLWMYTPTHLPCFVLTLNQSPKDIAGSDITICLTLI